MAMTRRDRDGSATPRGVTAVEALGCPACTAVAVPVGIPLVSRWLDGAWRGACVLDLAHEVS